MFRLNREASTEVQAPSGRPSGWLSQIAQSRAVAWAIALGGGTAVYTSAENEAFASNNECDIVFRCEEDLMKADENGNLSTKNNIKENALDKLRKNDGALYRDCTSDRGARAGIYACIKDKCEDEKNKSLESIEKPEDLPEKKMHERPSGTGPFTKEVKCPGPHRVPNAEGNACVCEKGYGPYAGELAAKQRCGMETCLNGEPNLATGECMVTCPPQTSRRTDPETGLVINTGNIEADCLPITCEDEKEPDAERKGKKLDSNQCNSEKEDDCELKLAKQELENLKEQIQDSEYDNITDMLNDARDGRGANEALEKTEFSSVDSLIDEVNKLKLKPGEVPNEGFITFSIGNETFAVSNNSIYLFIIALLAILAFNRRRSTQPSSSNKSSNK